MRKLLIPALVVLAPLGACSTPYTSPVAVDRFVAADRAPLTANDSIVVEAGDLNVPPAFVGAVAREIEAQGYAITARSGRYLTAVVDVEIVPIAAGYRRSPVDVGVGGSTGSYGSGIGAGVGINLGGSEAPSKATRMQVTIRNSLGASVWEGRAEVLTGDNSDLADSDVAAQALAAALFQNFPGENGERYEVDAD